MSARTDKRDRAKKDQTKDAASNEAKPTSSMVLVTWSDDHKLKIWQSYATTSSASPSIECSLELSGHNSLVFTADSDGEIIVSGGIDER